MVPSHPTQINERHCGPGIINDLSLPWSAGLFSAAESLLCKRKSRTLAAPWPLPQVVPEPDNARPSQNRAVRVVRALASADCNCSSSVSMETPYLPLSVTRCGLLGREGGEEEEREMAPPVDSAHKGTQSSSERVSACGAGFLPFTSEKSQNQPEALNLDLGGIHSTYSLLQGDFLLRVLLASSSLGPL